jgi:hypothetical protein
MIVCAYAGVNDELLVDSDFNLEASNCSTSDRGSLVAIGINVVTTEVLQAGGEVLCSDVNKQFVFGRMTT